MFLRSLLVVLQLGLPAAALAETAPGAVPEAAPAEASPDLAARIAALSETLQMGRVMEVMRDEGLDYGRSLRDEMFPAADERRWQAAVALIYDAGAMRRGFDAALQDALAADPAGLAEMEAFFASPRGQRILTLEIEARAAMLDEAVEDAAKVAARKLEADRDPLVKLLTRFAEAGDLIERNVAGALTSNLAFYQGLAAEGAFPEAMTEDEMLAEIWAQEPQIRRETTDWLMPYLALAYQPLEPGDLEAYIAFGESPAGQALNAAIFAGFDEVFTAISHQLGRAAARQMQGDDI